MSRSNRQAHGSHKTGSAAGHNSRVGRSERHCRNPDALPADWIKFKAKLDVAYRHFFAVRRLPVPATARYW